MKDTRDLTPVEKHGVYWFKRDDKFHPFDDSPINGGKVRQCIFLLGDNKDYIEKNCNGVVATASSVHSPQALIVTRVAQEFGFKTVVGIGVLEPEEAVRKHPIMKSVENLGGTIIKLAGTGFNSTLYARLKEMAKKENYFIVQFGINLKENVPAIMGSTAKQVKNLPNRLDNLVIPVGSGITMSGILRGLREYKKRVRRIIGIQIAGVDRRKTIDSLMPRIEAVPGFPLLLSKVNIPYEFYMIKGVPYATMERVTIKDDEEDEEFTLDPIYEAKAFKYMVKHLKLDEDDKTLFWIVGNSWKLHGVEEIDKLAKEFYELFHKYPEYYNHIRYDYIRRMVEKKQYYINHETLILWHCYKTRTKIGNEPGDYILKDLVTMNPGSGNAKLAVQEFFKMVQEPVFGIVRFDNERALNFDLKQGYKKFGSYKSGKHQYHVLRYPGWKNVHGDEDK
jgi:1-aminocyclopropane-1-carboxylate deaminase/D-cysteine desulfhydrase-like pyridoxal-dependent ACC family enzyme